MKKYTLKRILTSLFTLLAILLVLFILMQLMPGSPFNDEKLTPDMRAALYAKYGLDQPIYIQFFRYVGNMLRGDLGVSYNISKNTPISQLIQSRLPISIQVGGMAVTLGAIAGLVLGILAALKRDTVVDTIATIISVIGVSVPSYVFALALSYTFGFKFRWFPMLFSAKDIFGSSVLPSISLSMFTMASIARFTRSEMIEVLDHPALFTDGRIPREAVPAGLYAYDLYESCDTGNFCYIAPLVVVNHGGTVLTKEPIDFGGADRIDLTEDTSPNFLGGAMRVHDFMAASLDELRQYSEEPQLGGM